MCALFGVVELRVVLCECWLGCCCVTLRLGVTRVEGRARVRSQLISSVWSGTMRAFVTVVWLCGWVGHICEEGTPAVSGASGAVES